jgi:hypothetical protein
MAQQSTDPRLAEMTDRVRSDLSELGHVAGEKSAELRDRLYEFVQQQPLPALGAAFAVGYLLSGALFSRATGRVVAMASRILLGRLAQQVLDAGALGALSGERPATR